MSVAGFIPWVGPRGINSPPPYRYSETLQSPALELREPWCLPMSPCGKLPGGIDHPGGFLHLYILYIFFRGAPFEKIYIC